MYKTVTPKEAKELLEAGYHYVDVRTEEEFADGHVEGARNVPIAVADGGFGMRANPDFVRVMAANFPKDAKLVLGCKAGGRSAKACEILMAEGFTDVVNMDGGFHGRYDPMGRLAQPGWSQEGLPTATDPDDGCDYGSLASKA